MISTKDLFWPVLNPETPDELLVLCLDIIKENLSVSPMRARKDKENILCHDSDPSRSAGRCVITAGVDNSDAPRHQYPRGDAAA